jgi:hypothetical protein
VVAVEVIQVAAAALGHHLAGELVIFANAHRSDRGLVAFHPGAEVAGLVGSLHAELIGVAAGAGVAQGGGEGAVDPVGRHTTGMGFTNSTTRAAGRLSGGLPDGLEWGACLITRSSSTTRADGLTGSWYTRIVKKGFTIAGNVKN